MTQLHAAATVGLFVVVHTKGYLCQQEMLFVTNDFHNSHSLAVAILSCARRAEAAGAVWRIRIVEVSPRWYRLHAVRSHQ